MNLQSLTLSDCLVEVSSRILLPAGESPSQEQLEAEFLVYKQELIDAENARLAEEARIADLKARFSAMSDIGLLQGVTGISNIHAYFRDSILGIDKDQAENNMLALESAYEMAESEMNADAWLKNRQSEYAKLDNMLLEALAEDYDGRPEKMNEYLALREQIKLANPKPV